MKEIDSRFVGMWKGTDNGSYFVGEVNSWILNRYENGVFKIQFTTQYANGGVETLEEQGEWWVTDRLFYELKEKATHYECYAFVVLSPNTIQFIDTQDDFDEPYTFLDQRIMLD
ncbi:hypothetical protein K5I29_04855 [Flavobacterium agricola]|uniref:Uncharacterized protein n=1 Tax=Flavobacterium agricola TaxID=2870839 RepID=A0ABY6M345_9FLAO|nr:hypothetical protein [Flavobacterium agricola]UYW02235.1 hypothetical protein K5I29_04855 [Flavobacterium agricola]